MNTVRWFHRRRAGSRDAATLGDAVDHADDAARQVAKATTELRLAYQRIAPILDQLPGATTIDTSRKGTR